MIRDLQTRPHLIERKAGAIVATPLYPAMFCADVEEARAWAANAVLPALHSKLAA